MGLLIAKHIKNDLIKEAIQTLSDENKQFEIVKNDENIFGIRELATKQIASNDLLKEIIFDTSDTEYAKGNLFDIREIAAKQVTDEETLVEIVNSYYDETVDTKYGLNVVKQAVKGIGNDDVLLNISENNYDEEIKDIALEKVNSKFENLDKSKLRMNCDDDIKVKRMHAVDQIDDNEMLLDIAMNAKYLDVREKALSKIGFRDEKIDTLNDLIVKEKEYSDSINEYIVLDEDNEESKQDLINKASNLGVEYKRIGNPKKEKFYNEQCKLFEN